MFEECFLLSAVDDLLPLRTFQSESEGLRCLDLEVHMVFGTWPEHGQVCIVDVIPFVHWESLDDVLDPTDRKSVV